MGRTFCRSRTLVSLLFPLLIGGSAAAPTAEALYRDAKAASARGDLRSAATIAANALKQLGARDDDLTWRLRILYADVLFGQANHKEGRALLQRPLPPRLVGTDIEVLRLRGLAVAAKRLGESAAGDALIQQAYTLAKKRPQTLASVLLVLATYDTEHTEKWSREAVKLSQKYGDRETEMRARGTIGFGLAGKERFDEAIGMWEPALSQARALGNRSLVQKFEGNLGWAYLELGDYEAASDLLTRAFETATQIGADFEVVPWTYQLGNIRLQQGDLAAAGKQYRAALDLAEKKTHAHKPIVLAYLANYELMAGRIAEAQQYCDESLRARRASKDTEGELRSLLIAGRIALAAGKFEESKRLLQDVISRTTSNSTKSEAHSRLALLHVKQANFMAADEQFRASVKVARAARENIGAPELRFSFFTAVEELFDTYVDFLIARGRVTEALNVAETSRAQTLGEGSTDAAEPRDVRIIARDAGATILCYWLGSARSYLWIVTPQKVDYVSLPPKKTIESLVDAYQRDLLSGPRGSLTMSGARGTALWEMLAAPAAPFIAPRSRVIVVPHGRLAAFNLETLVVPKPKPHYWIEDAVISTAGSIALLTHNEPKRTAPSRLLLVGNAPPPAREFVVLPRADDEMKKVAAHFDRRRSVILSGAGATPSAYRSKAPEAFTYLHFVAHGVAARLKPLDSAVVLAREGDTYKLYARDIAKQPLTAKLVTISSCHGAGTRAYAGEGLVGLGWAFLRAGADHVVAALWEVTDAATPELMDRFYGSLAKDIDPATALRDAKLTLMRKGGAYSRPYYWAPFLLYGNS